MVLGQVSRQKGIGWRADQGCRATDAGGIGDGEQQAAGKAILRRSRRHTVLAMAFDEGDDAKPDRHHHQGRRRVGDPHAEPRRGQHETADQAVRTDPGQGNDGDGDTAM
jgi:hypothetical protein